MSSQILHLSFQSEWFVALLLLPSQGRRHSWGNLFGRRMPLNLWEALSMQNYFCEQHFHMNHLDIILLKFTPYPYPGEIRECRGETVEGWELQCHEASVVVVSDRRPCRGRRDLTQIRVPTDLSLCKTPQMF